MNKKQNISLKILKIASLSIFYIIIGILLLFSIATLSKKREDDIPNIFGIGFLAVDERADSMVGSNKDSFNPGDLVFVKVIKKNKRSEINLEKLYHENAVVSFYDYNIKAINTHRVIEYDKVTNTIRTQGDNKPEPDSFYLNASDIIGVYNGKIKGLGKTVHFMQTPLGFALTAVLPMLILLVYNGYVLIKNIYTAKEVKLKETLLQNQEEERERLKKELLEELKRQAESEE